MRFHEIDTRGWWHIQDVSEIFAFSHLKINRESGLMISIVKPKNKIFPNRRLISRTLPETSGHTTC